MRIFYKNFCASEEKMLKIDCLQNLFTDITTSSWKYKFSQINRGNEILCSGTYESLGMQWTLNKAREIDKLYWTVHDGVKYATNRMLRVYVTSMNDKF